jgi:hypothetical protein
MRRRPTDKRKELLQLQFLSTFVALPFFCQGSSGLFPRPYWFSDAGKSVDAVETGLAALNKLLICDGISMSKQAVSTLLPE